MCSLFKAKDMGIDLGTANTLIFIKGSGIVLNEPSVIAVENRDGKTLAVGHEAKAMLGKAPASISVVRPLQDGVISDFDRTADMLKSFLETALKVKRIRNFRVVVGVPSGVTEVEKRAVEEIVRQMGATEVFILEEPMAAAIGAGMPVDGTNGCMIADIGGGTTEVAVVSLGGVVESESIKTAGDAFDEAIVRYVRRKHNILIGKRTAEELKIGIACLVPRAEVGIQEVKGRCLTTGLPKSVKISSVELVEAIAEPARDILETIHMVLERTPPELVSDVAQNGIVMAGGGSLIYGFDQLVEKDTGIRTTVVDDALSCAAFGSGKMLMNLNDMPEGMVNLARKRQMKA